MINTNNIHTINTNGYSNTHIIMTLITFIGIDTLYKYMCTLYTYIYIYIYREREMYNYI